MDIWAGLIMLGLLGVAIQLAGRLMQACMIMSNALLAKPTSKNVLMAIEFVIIFATSIICIAINEVAAGEYLWLSAAMMLFAWASYGLQCRKVWPIMNEAIVALKLSKSGTILILT